jgi:hypothetical protein
MHAEAYFLMFSHAITMSALSGSTSFASPYFLRLLDHLLRILKLPFALTFSLSLSPSPLRLEGAHSASLGFFLDWEVEGADGWRNFFRLMTAGQVIVYVFLLLPL